MTCEQPGSARLSYEEWTADKIKKLVPLNRWQEPEDIAAMAVFLASNRGRNMTGQTINGDGGYVMHWCVSPARVGRRASPRVDPDLPRWDLMGMARREPVRPPDAIIPSDP